MHSITSDELFEYVRIQCNDKYQGRLTGTPEYQACAEWLAGEFKEWGIAPASDKRSFMFIAFGSLNYYHVPMDNPDIIKPEIMEDLSQLLFMAVVKMANSPDPLR